MSLRALRPDGRESSEVWGQKGPSQTASRRGEQSLTDLTPRYFSPPCERFLAAGKPAGGVGGCKNGPTKKTIELQTPARSFLEGSNCVKCGHITQGNCGRGVMKSGKAEENPTLDPSSAVGNICPSERWKGRSDTRQLPGRAACYLPKYGK